MADELSVRLTVPALVAAFAAAERDTRAAFAMLADAEERLRIAFSTADSHARIRVSPTYRGDGEDWHDVERAVARMRRQAWRAIYDRLELRRVLSPSRARAVEKALDEDDPPEITNATVEAFVRRWAEDLGELFAESVREVYDWLRPAHDGGGGRYVTNSRLEVGERVVLTWMVERQWHGRGYRVRWDRADERLTALENVMRGLDGQGQRPRGHRADLTNAIEASPDGRAETPYFEVRAFKNGNLHLRFLRLDLLARLNRIAGGATLRPHESAAE